VSNTALTDLERAGGVARLAASATYSERKALALHLAALKAQGHAVSAHEVVASGERSGEMIAIHFLTCKRCSDVEV
jgi:hypothetical protein